VTALQIEKGALQAKLALKIIAEDKKGLLSTAWT
jgi:hypothetical protein